MSPQARAASRLANEAVGATRHACGPMPGGAPYASRHSGVNARRAGWEASRLPSRLGASVAWRRRPGSLGRGRAHTRRDPASEADPVRVSKPERGLGSAYLETPFPRTHRFYQRLGFTLTGEHRPFEDAPPIWTFRRPPADRVNERPARFFGEIGQWREFELFRSLVMQRYVATLGSVHHPRTSTRQGQPSRSYARNDTMEPEVPGASSKTRRDGEVYPRPRRNC